MVKSQGLCKKGGLCDLEALGAYPDAVVEVCIRCGKRLIYAKSSAGRVDNMQYLADHLRDTLQPSGATAGLFERTYGKEGVARLKDYVAKKQYKLAQKQEWQEMRQELRRLGRRGTMITL